MTTRCHHCDAMRRPFARGMSRRRAGRLLLVIVTVVGVVGAGTFLGPAPAWAAAAAPPPAASPDPVIGAAGDIACAPGSPSFNNGAGTPTACQQKATSDLLLSRPLAAVLPLGDQQYDSATAAEFAGSYAPTWGRLDPISRPVPGNHEYRTPGASGYYGYFGSAAGDPAKGYYSYDIGSWHLVALNGNCTVVACNAGSAQEQWLKADLAASTGKCVLASWHQPRFGTDQVIDDSYRAFWDRLYEAKADLVLNGHRHRYERFAQQNPLGTADAAAGIRQFIVGTGGEDLEGWPKGTKAAKNSEVRSAGGFGALFLTLHATTYDFSFTSTGGRSFTDSGSGSCHAKPPAATASPYAASVLADRPSGYWRLGETAGTTAADSSGNSRTGTISGGVTLGATGAVAGDSNTAIGFDGGTGQVAVADADPLRLNTPFTIELFAKLDTFANTWPGLLGKGPSYTANGWLIWYQADGTVWFKRNGQKWGTGPGAITTDRYHHLAVTFDGTTLRWYVDGAQTTAAPASFPAITGTDPMLIGQGDNAGRDTIDELAVYPTALTAPRIQAHLSARA